MDVFEKLVAIQRIRTDRGIAPEDKVLQIHELTAPAKKSKGKTREEPQQTGFDRQEAEPETD